MCPTVMVAKSDIFSLTTILCVCVLASRRSSYISPKWTGGHLLRGRRIPRQTRISARLSAESAKDVVRVRDVPSKQ